MRPPPACLPACTGRQLRGPLAAVTGMPALLAHVMPNCRVPCCATHPDDAPAGRATRLTGFDRRCHPPTSPHPSQPS